MISTGHSGFSFSLHPLGPKVSYSKNSLSSLLLSSSEAPNLTAAGNSFTHSLRVGAANLSTSSQMTQPKRYLRSASLFLTELIMPMTMGASRTGLVKAPPTPPGQNPK